VTADASIHVHATQGEAMSQLMSIHAPRIARLLLVCALALPCAAVAANAVIGGGPQVIRSAACDNYRGKDPEDRSAGCRDEEGLAGFTSAANAIVNPAVLAMVAIAPLACLVGAGALMFGNRRGLTIIGSALGVLVFLISIRGIVA